MKKTLLFLFAVSSLSHSPLAEVSGTVVDQLNQQPVPGVTVKWAYSGESAVTDAAGNFTLNVSTALTGEYPAAGNFSLAYRANGRNFSLFFNGKKLSLQPLSLAVMGTDGHRVPVSRFDCGAESCTGSYFSEIIPGIYFFTIVSGSRAYHFSSFLGPAHSVLVPLNEITSSLTKQPAVYTSTPGLVELIHSGYRWREANVTEGGGNLLSIVPVSHTAGVYFPPVSFSDGIESGTLEEVSANPIAVTGALANLYNGLFDDHHSILVFKNGKLVYEDYFIGNTDTFDFEAGIVKVPGPDIQWKRTTPHYVASVNKSFTSAIMGIVLEKHGIAVDETLAAHLPEYDALLTGSERSITIKNALTMTMGYNWDEWAQTSASDMWMSSDLPAFVFNTQHINTPGTVWKYNSGAPNILLRLADVLEGGNLRTFADENFFGPLNITNYDWQSQPNGSPEGGARLFITARDMLRLGITLKDGGMFNGRRIIPADYVQAATSLQIQNTESPPKSYGYYFWIRNVIDNQGQRSSYFAAEGDGGNYINVFPDHDLIMVFTCGAFSNYNQYENQIAYFVKALLPLFR